MKLNDYQRMLVYMDMARNPFGGSAKGFRQFRQDQVEAGSDRLYMVARLDGPSVAVAKGLAEKAMLAETKGVAGKGYFDGKRDGRSRNGSALGDWWIRRAAIEVHNAGFPTAHTTKGHVLEKGECADALFYWGWYKPFAYNTSAFNGRFPVGAIGCHIASYEAAHLRTEGRVYRHGKQGPWCPGMLRDGMTATMGPVAEPYLHAFPHTDVLFPRLFQGWTLAEAYWAAVPHVSWMMILLGDPLYTPFAGENTRKTYVTGRISFATPAEPGESTALAMTLQAVQPLFKDAATYRVIDPQSNDPNIKLEGLNTATFAIEEAGRKLVVTGPRLTRTAAEPLRNSELEVHVDLGVDGGKKIVSQSLP